MIKIKGNYNECKEKIMDEYMQNSNSICEYFEDTICEDLSIQENVKLYADLRKQCDGDIVVNCIDKDNIILLDSDETIDIKILAKLIEW